MTTPGGPAIGSGDDYVATRLSIDIPDDAAENVREITQAVERYRTTLEAAARAEADVASYLEQMTEASNTAAAAQQNLSTQLQTFISLMGRSGMPGVQPSSTGVPGGPATMPFGGSGGQFQTAGMGSPTGERPPNPSDVAAQLNAAPGTNPREYLNMKNSRGGVTAQDVINISPQSIQELADKIASREQSQREHDLHTRPQHMHEQERQRRASASHTAQRVQRATGMAGQVVNEMEHGSTLGVMGMGVQGLRDLASRHQSKEAAPGPASESEDGGTAAQEAEGVAGNVAASAVGGAVAGRAGAAGAGGAGGGVMGSVMKMLGPIAGVAAAALGAFGLVQKGGEMVQGARNVAAVRGGAGGEGAQVELKARMMAMNPFITQDQSRQIYQAVMSEGYADASGAGADNVIDFMKTNLTSMNISVADSAKMLRATISGSGKGDPASVAGSVEMLRNELGAIRSLSRESKISTPDYTRQVAGLSETMMAGGATPQGAEYSAIVAEEVGSGDLALRGQFAMASGDMAQGSKAGAMLRSFGGPGGTPLRNIPTNLITPMIPAFLSSTGELDDAQHNVLTYWAKMAAMQDHGDAASELNAVYFFQKYVQMVAPSMDAANNLDAAKSMYHALLAGESGPMSLGSAKSQVEAKGIHKPSGGGGSRGAIPFQPQAPSNDVPGAPDTSGGGGNLPEAPPRPGSIGGSLGAGGGGTAKVSIGLTPEASRLLQVMGPQVVPLPPNKTNANAGRGGSTVRDKQ